MARISTSTSKSREKLIDPERIKAAKDFQIGQAVLAYGREGRVRKIDLQYGNITVAFGTRTDDYAAEILQKIDKKK